MMREFVKGVCILVIFVGGFIGAVAWGEDHPNPMAWSLRVGCPLVAIAAFSAFLSMHFRRDEAPDYLYQSLGSYFDRGGFCFAFVARTQQEICYLEAFFQNRYDRPSLGRIILRPRRKLFGKTEIDTFAYEVPCDPGAFGVVRLPVPLPQSVQGTKQQFEVGASVEYPEGKGRMLRFRNGMRVRSSSRFGNAFRRSLSVVGALSGMVVVYQPATVTIELPVGVVSELPEAQELEIHTLWKLGDPPLILQA